jgi:hypothetical protein
MVGETKPRPSPNRLLLTQRECESLIIDPARDSSEREGVSGVLLAASFGHSSTGPDSSCDRSPEAASKRFGGEDSIVQHHIEQRFMNPDAAVVLNKAELTKAIHEEADARPGRSNHLCQSFLRDLWNQRLWFPWLAKLR